MKDNRDWVKGAELNKNSLIEYKLSHQKKLCVMINEEQNSFVKQLYYKCTYYTVQIISHSVKFLQSCIIYFIFFTCCALAGQAERRYKRSFNLENKF